MSASRIPWWRHASASAYSRAPSGKAADGKQRSKQFKRRRDALAFASVTEVDRQHGTLVDPRLGRITVGEWWDQWWPTVTNLRPSTKARDEHFFRTHARPVFGSTPLGKLDRTALRAWVADLGYTRWHRFRDDARLGRARCWLAERSYCSSHHL